MVNAEKKLKALMEVEHARVFIADMETQKLVRYNEKGEKESYPLDCGLVGHTFRKRKVKNVGNAYNHHRFNGIIDIETSMPTLSMPIMHPGHADEALGVVQVINSKGVIGVATMKKPKISQTDFETLEFFAKQLAQSILNNLEWEKRGPAHPPAAQATH
jgi:GAF domain-containing protein